MLSKVIGVYRIASDIELKDIRGYKGKYAVSSNGDVYSYPKYRHNGKLLKQYKRKDGYMEVGLSLNKKRKTFIVHRLIAKEFIDNPENKPEINHIDGNKQNNNIQNLEWATSSENQVHAIKNHLQKFTEKHRVKAIETGRKNGLKNRGRILATRKFTKEQDAEIKKRFLNGESSIKLAKEFDVSKKTILNIKNDRNYRKDKICCQY